MRPLTHSQRQDKWGSVQLIWIALPCWTMGSLGLVCLPNDKEGNLLPRVSNCADTPASWSAVSEELNLLSWRNMGYWGHLKPCSWCVHNVQTCPVPPYSTLVLSALAKTYFTADDTKDPAVKPLMSIGCLSPPSDNNKAWHLDVLHFPTLLVIFMRPPKFSIRIIKVSSQVIIDILTILLGME